MRFRACVLVPLQGAAAVRLGARALVPLQGAAAGAAVVCRCCVRLLLVRRAVSRNVVKRGCQCYLASMLGTLLAQKCGLAIRPQFEEGAPGVLLGEGNIHNAPGANSGEQHTQQTTSQDRSAGRPLRSFLAGQSWVSTRGHRGAHTAGH